MNFMRRKFSLRCNMRNWTIFLIKSLLQHIKSKQKEDYLNETSKCLSVQTLPTVESISIDFESTASVQSDFIAADSDDEPFQYDSETLLETDGTGSSASTENAN